MTRFETITVREPTKDWGWLGLVPGAILQRNYELFRIVGSCKGRQRLLLRRLA